MSVVQGNKSVRVHKIKENYVKEYHAYVRFYKPNYTNENCFIYLPRNYAWRMLSVAHKDK